MKCEQAGPPRLCQDGTSWAICRWTFGDGGTSPANLMFSTNMPQSANFRVHAISKMLGGGGWGNYPPSICLWGLSSLHIVPSFSTGRLMCHTALGGGGAAGQDVAMGKS